MNDELKEIIELINTKYEDYYIDDFLSGEDVKKLVDYITNLQKENERLKDELETMTFTAKVKQEAIDALIKRIDKTIEYIQEDIIGNYFKRYDDEIYKMCDDLLEILKGDSDV